MEVQKTIQKLKTALAIPSHISHGQKTQAAVLVPLLKYNDQLNVLFTKRPAHMRNHPRQISFPGGRKESHDKTLIETALRETHEELGIPSERIEILGCLEISDTLSDKGYSVTPVVGIIEDPVNITPDPNEVESYFKIPFEFLMNEDNYQENFRIYNGAPRKYYSIDYDHYYIWGLTVRILLNLKTIYHSCN